MNNKKYEYNFYIGHNVSKEKQEEHNTDIKIISNEQMNYTINFTMTTANIKAFTIINNNIGVWLGTKEKTTILRIIATKPSSINMQYIKAMLTKSLYQHEIMLTKTEIEIL